MNPETAGVIPATDLRGEGAEETRWFKDALAEAISYLGAFAWCRGIRESYYGSGVGGVVAVFLFRIDSHPTIADEWLWVVVGDLPSAYLVVDEAPNSVAALKVYCGVMEDWVAAVREGKSLGEEFPVAAEPTTEHANMLERRIRLLRSEIVPALESVRSSGNVS